MSQEIVRVTGTGIKKSFGGDGSVLNVLNDISVSFPIGGITGIRGVSGGGKTTLINIVGLLMRPDEGEICLELSSGEKINVADKGQRDVDRIINRYFYYVFQNTELIGHWSVWENIGLPLMARGYSAQKVQRQVLDIVDALGMDERLLKKKISYLSGGEKQRIGIARALAADRPVLIADEPTGNLDPKNTEKIMEMLGFAVEQKKIVVLVSHDKSVIANCLHKYELIDGQLHEC